MSAIGQHSGALRIQAAAALQELASANRLDMAPTVDEKADALLAKVKSELATPGTKLHGLGPEVVTDALVNLRFDAAKVEAALGQGEHGADLQKGLAAPRSTPTLAGTQTGSGPPPPPPDGLADAVVFMDAPQSTLLKGVVHDTASQGQAEVRATVEPEVEKSTLKKSGRERFQDVGHLMQTHVGKRLSPFKSLEAVKRGAELAIEKGTLVKPALDKVAVDVAAEIGGRTSLAPVKSERRTIEKAINDYNSDARRTKDMARNTIIVPDGGNPADVVARLQARAGGAIPPHDLKTISPDGPKGDPCGYSGMSVIFPTEAGKGEIQINTAMMIYAKEANAREILGDAEYLRIRNMPGMPSAGQGHELYEDYRKHPPGSDEARAIAGKSKEYYTKVREAYAKATREMQGRVS